MVNAAFAIMPIYRMHKMAYTLCAVLLAACFFGCGKQSSPSENGFPSVQDSLSMQGSRSVWHLIDTLNRGDLVAKYNALLELEEFKEDAKLAVPTLVRILEDEEATIPGAAAAAEQGLISRPEDANDYLRTNAAAAVGSLGPVAKPAVPALLSTLKAKDKLLRMTSIRALGSIGVKENKVMSALKEALNDPDIGVEIAAVNALWLLDAVNQDAASTITKLLRDEDPEIRMMAASTLHWPASPRIKSVVPALLLSLKDSDEEVRAVSAQSLGHIHEEPLVVVPALIERLEKDTSFSVRVQAAQALGEYGPEAKSAIIALTRATKEDPASSVRDAAAHSIGMINELPANRGEKAREKEDGEPSDQKARIQP